MPSRVFISYSSRDDARAVESRDLVRAALEAAGYDVFVDKQDLKPGGAWRRRIRREIVERHAGIILFTRGALTSEWVWHEASIMSLVREFSSSFTLIPALLDGVTVRDLLTPRFAPLGLDALQHTQGRTPEEIAQEIVGVLGTAPPPETLLEKLAARIDKKLAAVPDSSLQDVAEELGGEFLQWKPDGGRRDFARAIARTVLNEGMHGVRSIIQVLASVLEPRAAHELLEVLAPLWVHVDDAARILQIVKRGSPAWCVGLNGRYVSSFTARMYLERAYWPWPFNRPKIIPVTGATGENLVEHIRQQVLTFVVNTHGCLSHEEADEYLRTTDVRVFINLPRTLWDKAAIIQLRADYPNATFILDTGEASPEPGDSSLPDRFEALPEIDVEQEHQAWVKYRDACGAVGIRR